MQTSTAQVVQQLEAAVGRARQCRGRSGAPDLAVVLDGRALVTALGADCKAEPPPRLDADPFPRFEARDEPPSGPAPPLPPPPALY